VKYRASFVIHRFTKLLFSLGVLLAAGARLSAALNSIVPDYQVGETARVEVVATVGFTAVDAEKTEALRVRETGRLPVIYRHDTNAVARAVENLHESFATNRQNFKVRIESTFNRRFVDEAAFTNQRFTRLVSSMQSANKNFPLTMALAQAWSMGAPDTDFVTPFEEKLILAMTKLIRADEQPADAKIGYQAKVIPSDALTPLPMAEVERARLIARSNVLVLSKWRGEATKAYPAEEKAAARFIASLIQPTCFLDMTLTRELRERQLRDLTSAIQYRPGDILVRSGEVVTVGSKAALDEFRARLAALRVPEAPPPAVVPWVIVGAVSVIALGVVIVYLIRSRRQNMALALLPESLGQDAAIALRNDPIIRARLVEHLTRLLGQSAVQRLIAQRSQLLNENQAAAVQTGDIEQRLERVQSQMVEKFQAYEKRIAGLEKELASAEEQNRDLIRAKIALAKQELEAELARGRVDWN
jgi:hypothetical protein